MQRSKAPDDAFRWDDARLFLALCRSSTLSTAATALGVDASTVSRRLVVLESVVKATLFDRGRDGITPTKAAEDLMPVAEEIEAVIHRFTRTAEGLEREISGLVRITCPADVAEVIVAPLLADLQRTHPLLRFELDSSEAVLDLTRREADLALRIVRPASGELVITRLATITWVVAASPSVARELGTLKRWADARWIGWGELLRHIGPARWYADHVRREHAVRSDSLTVQIGAVAAGLGVALIPSTSVAHYGFTPVALTAKLRTELAACQPSDLYLVTHRALRDVPRVRAVWEGLVARLAPQRRSR